MESSFSFSCRHALLPSKLGAEGLVFLHEFNMSDHYENTYIYQTNVVSGVVTCDSFEGQTPASTATCKLKQVLGGSNLETC